MHGNQNGEAARRALVAASLGNVIEWFDYGVYSFAAVTIGMHFFPASSPAAAALASFAVFALSFLVRPIGGIVMGTLGDKQGRRGMLMLTVGIMTLGTGLIGLLPTYSSIGAVAPVLLILARMLQGFSAGGEYGGANTFMTEVAPKERRGFFSSFLESGVLLGFILGAAVVVGLMHLLSDDVWNTWGWRIPFLISWPLGLLAIFLRRNLSDSPVFENMKQSGTHASSPLAESFRRAGKPMFITAALIAFANSAYYLILVYLPTYLQTDLKMSGDKVLLLSICIMLAMMIAIPIFGKLGDRVGRRSLMAITPLFYLLCSSEVVTMLHSGNEAMIFIAAILAGLAIAPFASQYAAALTILFPRSVRCTAFTLAYNVGTAALGGTSPFIVSWLTQQTGNNYMVAYFQMTVSALGLVAIAMMTDTKDLSADHDMTMAEGKVHATRLEQHN